VLAGVLIALGLAPIPWSIARIGMITTVLSLVAVGLLHFFLETMYVSRGNGVEIERLN